MQEIPSKPLSFIWFAFEPYKKGLFWALVCVFVASTLGSMNSLVFKNFVDTANEFTLGQATLVAVFLWLMSYPVLNLFAQLSWRGSGFLGQFLTTHIKARIVTKLFDYLSLHSLSYFNDRLSGLLSEKISIVSDSVNRLVEQFLWSILGTLISSIIAAALLFYSNTNLGFMWLAGFVILVPINVWLTRKQNKLSDYKTEARSRLKGQIVDTVTNITAVQQYSRRPFEIVRLGKAVDEYVEADIRVSFYRERVLLINNVLIALFIGSIVLWSFMLWAENSITVGSLVLIATLTQGFIYSLTFIGQNLNGIMETYGAIKNGLEEIVRPHEIADRRHASKLIVTESKVVFENVNFGYERDSRKIFKDLSFSIKGGQKVGIVGTSGAGKTTLMKLLLRQHDLAGGKITIDGQDVSAVTQESLRENVSIVPQEPMLFHRTIRENIMYGKLDATEEEMVEVAKKAQAHDFIENLPQKYDSLVGERGVKLSVGQRQRIAIARAFLKNAPILILDEATSALDSESEVAVQKALQALMEGKTVFAIAHRLSTLREMDRILVFKGGQIVEDGTHRTLLKNKEGVYASFWAHQAGGFLKDE